MTTVDSLTDALNESVKGIQIFLEELRIKSDSYTNIELEFKTRENNLNDLKHEIDLKIANLDSKENQLKLAIKKLEDDRLNFDKEIEDNRKVSIVKNLQHQLNNKTSECDILTRQLNLYKSKCSKCELLTTICQKYNLNIEQINLDTIERAISLTQKNEIVESNNIVEEKSEQDSAEDAEDELEVEDYIYKGKKYYLDINTKDVYQRLEDDDCGEKVGHLDKAGRFHQIKVKK